jgi:hypothetical protein
MPASLVATVGAMDTHGEVTTVARRWAGSTRKSFLALVAMTLMLAEAQQAVIPEIQVTTAPIPDNEYDSARNGIFCKTCNFGDGNARFVYADADNNLWLAHVDYQTGDFIPPNGHGLLIDTNVAAATDYGNGPEWIDSAAGSAFVYTKYLDGLPHNDQTAVVGIARMVNGAWTTTLLTDQTGRVSPDGTKNPGDPDVYINYVTAPKGGWYWRKLSEIGVEHPLPLTDLTDGNARRWVPGTHSIIFQGHVKTDPLKVDQIFLYDIDTGVLEQLTFNPGGSVGVFMWRAPEFNNELVFFTMARFRQQILVYRKLPGADKVMRWTIIKTIQSFPALPYFFSPEPFTHNGRSYIFMEVSSSDQFFNLTIPNQLAISGINPLIQDFRLLTNDTTVFRLRLDPEYFITAKGPFIYYNRLVPETDTHPAINDGLWRVDTGLGPPK